ncbi:MAG: hypothetical protein CSA64_04415 [Arachnia propionica]|nr:MAG: hypothetical protein CSA64_04415 [Arachnia propionica]
MTYSLGFSARSDVGLVRNNNQDSGYASPSLLLVADGMGGAAAGDVAAAVAVLTARNLDEQLVGPEPMRDRLEQIVTTANERLRALTAADPTLDGMGTTFCGAMFDGTNLVLAHIGDSRCYLLRDGKLTQLTHDHSWVQQLIDENRLTPEQAATHPHRSLVLKVLNGQSNYEPDYDKLTAQPGDRLLLCSDGLSGMIDDAAIGELLAIPDLAEAADSLLAAALQAGGHDNITVVIGEVRDEAATGAASVTVGAAEELLASPGGPSDTAEAEAAAEEPSEPEEPLGPAPRRYWRRGLALGLIALLVVALSGWGVTSYAHNQYFIAASDNRIAIYNGLPGAVFGYSLNTLVEQRDTRVADLPVHYQNVVRNTIGSPDLASARETANILDGIAERCRRVREQRGNQAGPSPVVSRQPTPPATSTDYPTYLGTISPSAAEDIDPEFC